MPPKAASTTASYEKKDITKPHKTWCYTLNNYTDQELELVKNLTTSKHVCGLELGENGTPHLQGCITFVSSHRLAQCKKLLERAHWEPTYAKNLNHAFAYCMKQGNILVAKGFKTKTNSVSEATDNVVVRAGETLDDVMHNNQMRFARLHQGIKEIWARLNRPPNDLFREVEVIVMWGDAGSGKTRRAHEIDPNLYRVNVPSSNGMLWFDGYESQETILLDDFYGWIKYHELLHLLDGYNMQLQVKGGFTWAKWKRVIITSNKPPEQWYSQGLTPALARRITQTIKMVTDENIIVTEPSEVDTNDSNYYEVAL